MSFFRSCRVEGWRRLRGQRRAHRTPLRRTPSEECAWTPRKVPEPVERGDHIRHRETRAENHHPLLWRDLVQRARQERVRNHSRVRGDRGERLGRIGRGVRRGENHDLRAHGRSIFGRERPPVAGVGDLLHAVPDMRNVPRGNERLDVGRHIPPEHRPRRIESAVAASDGLVPASSLRCGEPAREVGIVARNERHARSRHIDPVSGVPVVIGKPAAEKGARLENGERGSGTVTGEVIGNGRAGEASSHDGHVERSGFAHSASSSGKSAKLRRIWPRTTKKTRNANREFAFHLFIVPRRGEGPYVEPNLSCTGSE